MGINIKDGGIKENLIKKINFSQETIIFSQATIIFQKFRYSGC